MVAAMHYWQYIIFTLTSHLTQIIHQFMYTTLFEVKLEELVKGGEQTARLIGEAADKCTQVRANAPLHF